VWTFPKNHALHTARYGVPQSALNHDQLTHSTPQSLTVSAAVWPPLPHLPCLSLSVCVCLVSHSVSVNCTAVISDRVLHAPAEHGKSPACRPLLGHGPLHDSLGWARSSPQVALVISRSARLNASRRTLTHTRHTIDPLRGARSRCLGLASNYCITADFRPRY